MAFLRSLICLILILNLKMSFAATDLNFHCEGTIQRDTSDSEFSVEVDFSQKLSLARISLLFGSDVPERVYYVPMIAEMDEIYNRPYFYSSHDFIDLTLQHHPNYSDFVAILLGTKTLLAEDAYEIECERVSFDPKIWLGALNSN